MHHSRDNNIHKKYIYLPKKGPANLVPANRFDGKIKYFLID